MASLFSTCEAQSSDDDWEDPRVAKRAESCAGEKSPLLDVCRNMDILNDREEDTGQKEWAITDDVRKRLVTADDAAWSPMLRVAQPGYGEGGGAGAAPAKTPRARIDRAHLLPLTRHMTTRDDVAGDPRHYWHTWYPPIVWKTARTAAGVAWMDPTTDVGAAMERWVVERDKATQNVIFDEGAPSYAFVRHRGEMCQGVPSAYGNGTIVTERAFDGWTVEFATELVHARKMWLRRVMEGVAACVIAYRDGVVFVGESSPIGEIVKICGAHPSRTEPTPGFERAVRDLLRFQGGDDAVLEQPRVVRVPVIQYAACAAAFVRLWEMYSEDCSHAVFIQNLQWCKTKPGHLVWIAHKRIMKLWSGVRAEVDPIADKIVDLMRDEDVGDTISAGVAAAVPVHPRVRVGGFPCSDCGVVKNSAHDLVRHVKKKHAQQADDSAAAGVDSNELRAKMRIAERAIDDAARAEARAEAARIVEAARKEAGEIRAAARRPDPNAPPAGPGAPPPDYDAGSTAPPAYDDISGEKSHDGSSTYDESDDKKPAASVAVPVATAPPDDESGSSFSEEFWEHAFEDVGEGADGGWSGGDAPPPVDEKPADEKNVYAVDDAAVTSYHNKCRTCVRPGCTERVPAKYMEIHIRRAHGMVVRRALATRPGHTHAVDNADTRSLSVYEPASRPSAEASTPRPRRSLMRRVRALFGQEDDGGGAAEGAVSPPAWTGDCAASAPLRRYTDDAGWAHPYTITNTEVGRKRGACIGEIAFPPPHLGWSWVYPHDWVQMHIFTLPDQCVRVRLMRAVRDAAYASDARAFYVHSVCVDSNACTDVRAFGDWFCRSVDLKWAHARSAVVEGGEFLR